MRKPVMTLVTVLVLGAGLAAAADRLAVLEFFGRPAGTYCSAAGPAMTKLQQEFAGRAVLLEYDYDLFRFGRQDRFWATGVSANVLPLVMVGSGYRTSSGSADYERVYRSMLEAELARAPPVGAHPGPSDILVNRDAGIWVIAYERDATAGVGETWVQSTALWYLPHDLEPGQGLSAIIDTPAVGGLDWERMAGLVLVDDRPAGGAYDMLQAAEALPADLYLAPERPVVGARGGTATLELAGPHVLSWTAASEVPWLVIEPSSGTLPATVSVELRPELRPAAATEGTISFAASGDGMSFSTTTTVTVGAPLRRGNRRIAPAP